MATGWTFTTDSEYQEDLVTILNTAADNYDAKVRQLFKEIEGMGSAWTGKDYDLFKNSTSLYKPALNDLADGFRMYAKHFDKMSHGTENLAIECIDIIKNMTGKNN